MFEIDKQKFGSFVAALRKEKGLTQKELAQHLFISDKAVSKWETAVSIPDTALLIPLADLLGVTVTELLLCERMNSTHSVGVGQVEEIVKTAISLSDDTQRAYQTKTHWIFVYAAALLMSTIGLFLSYKIGNLNESLITTTLLSAIFGAYFCCFTKVRLPSYYDENQISNYYDGILQMHIPGLIFNNSNWPYIVQTLRISTSLLTVFLPLCSIMMHLYSPVWLMNKEPFVLLVLLLGGLFIPLYAIGKANK